jgi:hypothetical protein
MQYVSLFGELEHFGGELIHGAKKIASSVVHHVLSFVRSHLATIEHIVHGCAIKGSEGAVGGGIGGAIFAPFVGPETIPVGAAGGAAGGCILGGFEGALGV